MKHSILATLIAIGSVTAVNAGSIQIAASSPITRHGGQDIPVTFTASGFAQGSTAQIWLVNSRTWQCDDLIGLDFPVVNGVNRLTVGLSWSWWETGKYVVRVVIGNNHCTGSSIVTIRSAIIYPYPGTVLPKNSGQWVTWTTESYIAADFVDIWLLNEDTGEFTEVANRINPLAGRAQFNTLETPGNRFRIIIYGYLLILFNDDDGLGDYLFPDLNEMAESGLLSIR